MKKNKKETASQIEAESQAVEKKEEYSLNDDRRVKVLSPGMLVMKRFFRNRLAVIGMSVLIFMFLFSFVGGLLSPYGEKEYFYREVMINREFGQVIENNELRHKAKIDNLYTSVTQAYVVGAVNRGETTIKNGVEVYEIREEGKDFYGVYSKGMLVGISYKDIVNAANEDSLSFDFIYAALLAYTNGGDSFECEGATYTLDKFGLVNKGDEEVAFISRYVVGAFASDVRLSRDFQEKLVETILRGEDTFTYTDESLIMQETEESEEAEGEDAGEAEETEATEETDEGSSLVADEELPEIEPEPASATAVYTIEPNANHEGWLLRQMQPSHQYDKYTSPSAQHWLGTDRYGMDVLTRLMYGGRVSLMIGFIVVFIETAIGVVFGGLAGYFGGWVDNLIMRLVDIFYCIPSTPILIIIGAAMDAQNMPAKIRIIYLMLILGVLGWAGIARLVRGQILSLREQEFMTATEACGISVRHRIFKHLVPNVIPQLIVSCTMSLGGVIITEATLSFLGLGVRFPFASWGNIINDVNNIFVLRTYWFVWIPAGLLLLLTVLAFNLVGDGLRDAFDPKMKR